MQNFYLIGLIGKIGSGKSTVRQMLEQLGAYSIDADMLTRVVMRRGTATWSSVVDAFGVAVLRFDGNIDRAKLGTRVFAHPPALEQLETLVHPAVRALTKDLLLNNDKPVVVVEAIKLIQAGCISGVTRSGQSIAQLKCKSNGSNDRAICARKTRARALRCKKPLRSMCASPASSSIIPATKPRRACKLKKRGTPFNPIPRATKVNGC